MLACSCRAHYRDRVAGLTSRRGVSERLRPPVTYAFGETPPATLLLSIPVPGRINPRAAAGWPGAERMGTGQDREFEHQLREVLDHLFDFDFQRHPFAARLAPPQAAAKRGQALRRILLDAIEALNRGGAVPRRSPERRAHAILFGLYVEGRTQTDVARSLAIGARQLRRDRTAALRTRYALLAAREHADGGAAQG